VRPIGDGRLPTDGVVTHKMPLADFQKGIDMMHKGGGSIKIVLIP
jgi:Zn-dependent alcohol dehydrogenase